MRAFIFLAFIAATTQVASAMPTAVISRRNPRAWRNEIAPAHSLSSKWTRSLGADSSGGTGNIRGSDSDSESRSGVTINQPVRVLSSQTQGISKTPSGSDSSRKRADRLR
ncbi:hypothetical protein EIP91_004384 [Steccherinum ochraceum]|uniref:Uncharacterized protein n=1 Tax=Steccherinum ochraceum TaxID=92696 RepID=A0A4R0S1V3_9APHY|nr:hypothetical protein EIP91_004384 [Steccherinum ochraceum]